MPSTYYNFKADEITDTYKDIRTPSAKYALRIQNTNTRGHLCVADGYRSNKKVTQEINTYVKALGPTPKISGFLTQAKGVTTARTSKNKAATSRTTINTHQLTINHRNVHPSKQHERTEANGTTTKHTHTHTHTIQLRTKQLTQSYKTTRG